MRKECKCGHDRYSHGGVDFDGKCTIWDCKCKKFKEYKKENMVSIAQLLCGNKLEKEKEIKQLNQPKTEEK